MLKWLKTWTQNWNEIEAENLRAGIINVLHPYAGVYTYVDKEQYRKYLDDKKRKLSKDNRQTKV